jgi:ribose transport system permease protein
MAKNNTNTAVARFLSDYGMIVVLLLLCAFFSLLSLSPQYRVDRAGAEILAKEIAPDAKVLLFARQIAEDLAFTTALEAELRTRGVTIVDSVVGEPPDARATLVRLAEAKQPLDVIACHKGPSMWGIFTDVQTRFPTLGQVRVVTPSSYWWPHFLTRDNLLNIANQIAVIAIIAIGMTFVIMTAGIDLSVGSLIALSAVFAALLIRDLGGAVNASPLAMMAASLAAIALCGLVGGFSGAMVTFFRIPPFIVTLGMMQVASGLAFILARGQSIYQIPDSFVWLGLGANLFDIPNAVVLMLVLYAAAHILMTRMALGRYIYAVGGNLEAARLSGVPVQFVLLFVYTMCGALAGLGGIISASRLKSGSPNYGFMYELYAIAAVVVGGTSLQGGEGKILGTLIGAFIIAVIQNGMNLTEVKPYTQKVVLGLVILGAVLLDMLKLRWQKIALGTVFFGSFLLYYLLR